jgi:hypothetical protein
MEQNKTLHYLNVARNEIPGIAFRKLFKVLVKTALASLDCSQNPIKDSGTALFEKVMGLCLTLKKLNFTDIRITKIGFDNILRELYTQKIELTNLIMDCNRLDGNVPFDLRPFLQYMTSIKKLSFNNCVMNDAVVSELVLGLENSTKCLEEL